MKDHTQGYGRACFMTQQKKADELRRLSFICMTPFWLDRFDVLRPWAFGTLPLCERHLLPFVELIKGCAFNAGTVEEQVLPWCDFDETKAFVREPLD